MSFSGDENRLAAAPAIFLRMACSGSAGRNTPSHLALTPCGGSTGPTPGMLQFMVKDSHKAGIWDI